MEKSIMARILTDPFEVAAGSQSGWSIGTNSAIVTSPVRTWKTFGGSYCLRSSTGTAGADSISPSFLDHRHLFGKVGVRCGEVGSNSEVLFFNAAGSSTAFSVQSINTGVWKAYRGTTEIAASIVAPLINVWYLLEFEVFLHDTLGVFKVWIDNELIIDFSGDTYNGTVDAGKLQLGGDNTPYYDDIAVNSITMRYDTEASGPFTLGETITGGTSGATADITILQDDGTTGVLTLHGWDGTAFTDGETITGGASSTTAQVDAPNVAFINGFEPNSGRIGNEFITAIAPNANGTNSGLTGSDGNSTDNYLLVDERVTTGSPATYVDATVAAQKDTYKYDVSGSLPSAVTEITFLGTATYAQSSLTGIDGYNTVVRVGGVDNDGPREGLSASFALAVNPIPLDVTIATASDQSWLLATITDAAFEAGTKFVA
jgi:hypothetical protein